VASITLTYEYLVNGTPVGSPVQVTISPVASPPIDIDLWLVPDANVMTQLGVAGLAKLAINLNPAIVINSPTYPGTSPPQAAAYFNVGQLSSGQSVTLEAQATAQTQATAGGAYVVVWGLDNLGLITFSATKLIPPVTVNVSQGTGVTYKVTLEVQ